ncbi:hypothetical protein JAAARDRAFT_34567, partial [Jaapia argillacea MUCL 33604]
MEISVKVQLRSAPNETADSIEVTVGQSTGINGVLFVLAAYNKVKLRDHPHFYPLGGQEKSLETFHGRLTERGTRHTTSLQPLDLLGKLTEYKHNPLVVLTEREHRISLECEVSPRIIGNIWRAGDTYLVKESDGTLFPVEAVNKRHHQCSSKQSAGGSRDDKQLRAPEGQIGEQDRQTRPEDDHPRAEDDQPGVVEGETTNMVVAPEWESILRTTEARCILACRHSPLAPTPDDKKDEGHFDTGTGRRQWRNPRMALSQLSIPPTPTRMVEVVRFSMLRSAVPAAPTTASAQQAPQLPTAYPSSPSSAPKQPQLPDVNQSGTPRAPDVVLPRSAAHPVSEVVSLELQAVNLRGSSSVEDTDKSSPKRSSSELEPQLIARFPLPSTETMPFASTSIMGENPTKSLGPNVFEAQDNGVVELDTKTLHDSMMPGSFPSTLSQDRAIGESPPPTTQGDYGTIQILVPDERSIVRLQQPQVLDQVIVPAEPTPPPVPRQQPPAIPDTSIDTESSPQNVSKKKRWWKRMVAPVVDIIFN